MHKRRTGSEDNIEISELPPVPGEYDEMEDVSFSVNNLVNYHTPV